MVVLSTSMLVTVVGLSATMLVRVERRAALAEGDYSSARFLAQTAVEYGQYLIDSDPNWRTVRSPGTWANGLELGSGSFSLHATDPVDGSFANGGELLFTATGTHGAARSLLRVTLEPVIQPLNCLASAVHTGGDVTFSSSTVSATQLLSSNGQTLATLATVNCDVEAASLILGVTYNGKTTASVSPKEMPTFLAFDYYLTNGTAISYNSLGGDKLERIVLSPAVNPYGAVNAQGIYIIDCGGQTLKIRESRIVGTLVLLNPGSGSMVEKSNLLQPATANHPVLMVNGNFTIALESASLSESSAGVTFNPPGTPYEGVSDTDRLDNYPSKIAGLVYVSGNLSTAKAPTIEGVLIVGGTLLIEGQLSVAHSTAYTDSPPPGFYRDNEMFVKFGSWMRTTD